MMVCRAGLWGLTVFHLRSITVLGLVRPPPGEGRQLASFGHATLHPRKEPSNSQPLDCRGQVDERNTGPLHQPQGNSAKELGVFVDYLRESGH